MIDAIGKPPSGLLDFNLQWPGNYDECVQTQVSVLDNSTGLVSEPFAPQYCKASFVLGQNPVSRLYFCYRPLSINMDKMDDDSK